MTVPPKSNVSLHTETNVTSGRACVLYCRADYVRLLDVCA